MKNVHSKDKRVHKTLSRNKINQENLTNIICNNFILELFIQHCNFVVQITDLFQNAYFKEHNNMTEKTLQR